MEFDWNAAGVPFPNQTSTDESYSHVWTEPLQLHVNLLSGTELATVQAKSTWSGREMKDALLPFLPKATVAATINFGTLTWEDSLMASELGLTDEAELHVILQACEIQVTAASVSAVNGFYTTSEEQMNGASSYTNEAGTLLFRYHFPNGVHYWYFSRPGNLTKSLGDYYRVKSEGLYPPLDGWAPDKCPLGFGCAPSIKMLV